MRHEPGHGLEERALACTVRSDEPDELPGRKLEGRLDDRSALPVAHADAFELERHRFPSRPCRRISCRKNGAPISAVTTPSFNSGPGGIMRIATSARSVSVAPATKHGTSRRRGWWPTQGLSMCGT